ncbi:MAG: hypothetical protein Q4C46_02950 [Bacillota bacterium]|nr:hypothetical protein [Bacillota bacterium]
MNIYGKIIGETEPVFIASGSQSDTNSGNVVWPIIATFDDDGCSYILLTDGDIITGFKYKYIYGEDVILDTNISEREFIKIKVAYGILKVSIIKEYEYLDFKSTSFKASKFFQRFIDVVKNVKDDIDNNFDIIGEIGSRMNLSEDKVLQLLLKISEAEVYSKYN